jgi:hypothetical protein
MEKLHNESFITRTRPKISLGIKSRRMRWMGYVERMGEERKVYKVLVGKPPLGRPRYKWDQNGSYGDWLGA